MSVPVNPIVMIPARLAATRLPNKVLAEIAGEPMIVHVWRRAVAADIGPVVVAASDPEIAEAIEKVGGRAVLTRPDHPSGSDRIFEALERVDPAGRHDAVVNVQGDVPSIDPAVIRAVFTPLADPDVDIASVVVVITRKEDRSDPNMVKAVVGFPPGAVVGRALYFSRATVPGGDGPLYHHIGLYAYRRVALARFVRLPPGILERRERLEQLRALEAGMRIDVALVDTVPPDVNTPADLARARQMLAVGRRD
ncbi:MAG TPA: 3-deoxy-manno-octulosonate cytidylyltransferase [Alphaproteobacteria bacterium]|nr:3-deoxy-manno-octulosonate cytidylyltransferase [Alphaproteobacteria bacterium]